MAPLAGLLDYAERLRGLSRGRAAVTVEPQGFGAASSEMLDALLAEASGVA